MYGLRHLKLLHASAENYNIVFLQVRIESFKDNGDLFITDSSRCYRKIMIFFSFSFPETKHHLPPPGTCFCFPVVDEVV